MSNEQKLESKEPITKDEMIEFIVNKVDKFRPENSKMSEDERKKLTEVLGKFSEVKLNQYKSRTGFTEIIMLINEEMNQSNDFKKIDSVLRKFRDSTKDDVIEDIVELAINTRAKKYEVPEKDKEKIRVELTKTLNKISDEKLVGENSGSFNDSLNVINKIEKEMIERKLNFKKIDKILVNEFGDNQAKTQNQASTKQKIKNQVNQMKTGLQKVPRKISNVASNSASKISKTFSNLRKKTDKSNSR